MTTLFSLQLGYAPTNHPLVARATDPVLHYECFSTCRPPFKLKEPSTEQNVRHCAPKKQRRYVGECMETLCALITRVLVLFQKRKY